MIFGVWATCTARVAEADFLSVVQRHGAAVAFATLSHPLILCCMGVAAFDALVNDLFLSYFIATVAGAVGNGAPSDKTPGDRMTKVIDTIIKTVQTRQNYSFGKVISGFPDAIAALGWILDRAERRAAKVVGSLSPPVPLTAVYGVEHRESDNVVLLWCTGHDRLVETAPMDAARAAEAVAALRVAAAPRILLPEFFADSVLGGPAPAWSEFGVGNVKDFMDSRLDEAEGGAVWTEKTHFIEYCRNKVRAMVSKMEAAVRGGETVRVPVWAIERADATGSGPGVAASAVGGGGDLQPLASGPVWFLTRDQFPDGATHIELRPDSSAGASQFSLTLSSI